MPKTMDAIRSHAPTTLAALFSASGVLHFIRPETFVGIAPRFLPAPEAVVYASGAAEILCAAGLFARSRWAAAAGVVLLVAILPAFQSSPGLKAGRNGSIVRSFGMRFRGGLRRCRLQRRGEASPRGRGFRSKSPSYGPPSNRGERKKCDPPPAIRIKAAVPKPPTLLERNKSAPALRIIRVVYVYASLVRRTLNPVRRDGVGVSHATEETSIHTRAEAKYMRVATRVAAAPRKPEPPRNPVRSPTAVLQPVSDDGENGLRTKLADVEDEEFVEESGGERKLRKPFPVRAFRELAERGCGHPEAKTVSVQKRIEAAEGDFSAVPTSFRSHPEWIFEAETITDGVESLRAFRGFVLYFGSVRERRMPDNPDAARKAPVIHKTSAEPRPGTANHTASTPDAKARLTVSAKTAQRRNPVA